MRPLCFNNMCCCLSKLFIARVSFIYAVAMLLFNMHGGLIVTVNAVS